MVLSAGEGEEIGRPCSPGSCQTELAEVVLQLIRGCRNQEDFAFEAHSLVPGRHQGIALEILAGTVVVVADTSLTLCPLKLPISHSL